MKIFCDLDGTLIDVSRRHYQVYSEVVVQLGGVPIAQVRYWELKRKRTKWPELLQISSLSSAIEPDFLNLFIQKIENPTYLELDELFPNALFALRDMSKISECYLVSLRRNRNNLFKQLDRLNILGYFVEVLTGHSDNDGYDVKIALIGDKLNYDEGIIIGDTEADIITGKKLGLRTIAVKSGIRDEQFLLDLHPDSLVYGIEQAVDLI